MYIKILLIFYKNSKYYVFLFCFTCFHFYKNVKWKIKMELRNLNFKFFQSKRNSQIIFLKNYTVVNLFLLFYILYSIFYSIICFCIKKKFIWWFCNFYEIKHSLEIFIHIIIIPINELINFKLNLHDVHDSKKLF